MNVRAGKRDKQMQKYEFYANMQKILPFQPLPECNRFLPLEFTHHTFSA